MCFFTVFQGTEIFSIWEKTDLGNSGKIKINGHPRVQCLVNMADESELPGQAVTVFAWSSKNHALF